MTTILLRIATVLAAVFVLPQAARSGEAHWPETLTIGTGSPGGTYYDYGEGLARLLTRKLDIPVFTRSTEGPTENIKLLEAGEIQLAFVTLGVAQQAWNATGEWTGGKQFRAMRAIFPMYDTPFQFMVLQESGIPSIADLTDKRVGIGPARRHDWHLHAGVLQDFEDQSHDPNRQLVRSGCGNAGAFA